MASTLLYTRGRSVSIWEKMLLWYFPLCLMYVLLGMRGIDTHLILPLQAFIFVYGILAFLGKEGQKDYKILVAFFMFYSLFSICWVESQLLDGFINDARVVVLPMFAIFIGMSNNSDKLYKVFIYVVVISMIIGLFLYFVQPAWFIERMVEKWNEAWYSEGGATEDNILSGRYAWASRFSAIYGTPYGVSYFGTFALCLLTIDIYKKEENRLINKRWLQLFFFVILAVSVVLGQNRVAMVYLVLLAVWGLFYGIRYKRPERKIFLKLMFGLLLIGFVVLIRFGDNDFVTMIKDTLIERFEDTHENGLHNTARDNQISVTLNSWNNYIVGEGLGSRGGVVRSHGHPGVTDNGYVKLIVEQGVFGFILLLFLFIRSMLKAFKNRKVLYAEFFILGYVLFAMIGANPLGMEYDYMIIMWFAMGHIWNKQYIETCRIMGNHI